MNIQRAIETVRKANLALQRKEYMSAEQRKVFIRARAKANKIIKAFTHPSAPGITTGPLTTITMLEISLTTVKSVIQTELHITDVPLNETFKNLAVTDRQLDSLRGALYRNFGKYVRPMLSDTIYTYTDRLQQEKTNAVL